MGMVLLVRRPKSFLLENVPELLLVDKGAAMCTVCMLLLARPMSCVQEYFDFIHPHTVGSLTIPRASIKWA